MKIAVLDGYTENPGDLSGCGLEVLGDLMAYDRTSLTDEGDAIARIDDAELVYTNKTPITRVVLDACPSMKFISLLAIGYNMVDYESARQKGIPMINVPTYGTASVDAGARQSATAESPRYSVLLEIPLLFPSFKRRARRIWLS